MGEPLLEVDGLRVAFPAGGRMAEAVRGVRFAVETGEALGVLGESGSGKSVSALSIMRLIQSPGRITHGAVRFAGRDLLRLSDAEMRGLRGRQISMVFQDPLTAFNPVYKVGRQLVHVIRTHTPRSAQAGRERALEVLGMVGLPDPERVMRAYPHELSGGMRQRALIGMALACEPKLLIADEPTTALDVTVQAQIVELFHDLRRRLDLTLIYITHNLDLMAELCDRAIVMYAGRIVEESGIEALFAAPRHPYTRMLIDCVPRLEEGTDRALTEIKGMPPPIGTLEEGCPFEPRCPVSIERCSHDFPAEHSVRGHRAACWQAVP